MTAGQLPALAPLSEREWQQQVTDLAELLGWSWAHWRPAMTRNGWRTPVSGPIGAGFPDLLLAHPVHRLVLLVELKTNAGKVTHEQRMVHELLRRSGLTVDVWTPKDWSRVVDALSAGRISQFPEPSPAHAAGAGLGRTEPRSPSDSSAGRPPSAGLGTSNERRST